MNIWIVNHYAIMPDQAGGTRHYELAARFAEHGHHVTVVAAGLNYLTLREKGVYERKPWQVVACGAVDWVWIKTTPYQKNNMRRLVNMVVFSRNFIRFSNSVVSRPDLVIGSTVHPFAARAAAHVSRKTGAMFWFEIRDLWPQTMIDNGLWDSRNWRSRLFRWIERNTLKHARGVIALSPMTASYLEQHYRWNPRKVLLLPNGTCTSPDPVIEPIDENRKIILMYTGGMDTVHHLDHLIDALALPGMPENLEVQLIGEGKEKENLMIRSRQLGLKNVVWKNAVPKNEIPALLQQADLFYLSTSKVLYGSENKLAEYLEAGKPVLTYTAASHNDPVETIECGLSAAFGDVVDLAEKITRLASLSETERQRMGMRGRQYARENLGWDILAVRCLKGIGALEHHPVIIPAKAMDAPVLAQMHRDVIHSGFLSTLPLPFLTLLYIHLIRQEVVFCAFNQGKINGFVTATAGQKPLIRCFVARNPLRSAIFLLPVIFRKGMIRKLSETYRYNRALPPMQLPDPELLSIAVRPGDQSGGIGRMLLEELMDAFARKDIRAFKVIAGEELESANRFYRKNGFVPLAAACVHKGERSNIFIKTIGNEKTRFQQQNPNMNPEN